MSDKKELSFEEFAKMCEDAGIAADPADMEQDYRVGGVIADLVDELMNDMESTAKLASFDEGLVLLQQSLARLEREALSSPTTDIRDEAISLAAKAVRFAADLCHDEAGNN